MQYCVEVLGSHIFKAVYLGAKCVFAQTKIEFNIRTYRNWESSTTKFSSVLQKVTDALLVGEMITTSPPQPLLRAPPAIVSMHSILLAALWMNYFN